MTTPEDETPVPAALRLSEGLGPLVVNGVTFDPLRLPVPQIARGLPKEVHVFTREMLVAAVATERERCAAVCEGVREAAGHAARDGHRKAGAMASAATCAKLIRA